MMKFCHKDKERECPSESYPCRAWNDEHQECVFILKATEIVVQDGSVTCTMFPKSAPPPEVR
jgi:hypothetical protein